MTKPRIDVKAFAQKGAAHREEEHHGRQVDPPALPMAEPESTEKPKGIRYGGRKKAFEDEDMMKVALFLPRVLAGDLKALAIKNHKTPSQFVAEMIVERLERQK